MFVDGDGGFYILNHTWKCLPWMDHYLEFAMWPKEKKTRIDHFEGSLIALKGVLVWEEGLLMDSQPL